MTQELKSSHPMVEIRSILTKNREQIKMALPRHMSPDVIIRTALTTCQRIPQLMECYPPSILGAVIQTAQWGLTLDPIIGEAYPVPFKNNKRNRTDCELIVGYKGLLKLVKNTGQVNEIYAHAVFKGDDFHFSYGSDQHLHHVSKTRGTDWKDITHFYAFCKLTPNGQQFEVMTKEEVDAIRRRSKAANNGPWNTDYVEMGRKTVLRRLCKYLPKSPNLLKAVGLDEQGESGIPQDLSVLGNPNEIGTDIIDVAVMPEAKPETASVGDAQEPGNAPSDVMITEHQRKELVELRNKAKLSLSDFTDYLRTLNIKSSLEIPVAKLEEIKSWVTNYKK